MAHLGQRIRTLREQHGLTQNELAALVGVRQAAISLIESNDRWPSTKVLVRLASVLGTTIGDLGPTVDELQQKEEAEIEVAQ